MVEETENVWKIAIDKNIAFRTAAYVLALDRIGAAVNAKGTKYYYTGGEQSQNATAPSVNGRKKVSEVS
jgi:hypothetical protein